MFQPINYIRRTIKFPDPIEQAQVVFSTRPEDMRKAYEANESFLQSCSDYKNEMNGIDLSNQRLFQSITNMTPALMENKEDIMKVLTGLKMMSEQGVIKDILNLAKPMLIELIKVYKDDPDLQELLNFLTKQQPHEKVVDTWKGISRSEIDKFFADADLKEPPLFELTVHADYWFMGVGKELDSKSFFRPLAPTETEYITAIEAVNELNQSKQFKLTLPFCKVLIFNIVTDVTEVIEDYLELFNHCYGEKVLGIINQFKSGQVVGFPHTKDKYMIEENKLSAANMINNWITKSIKFREWIAPRYLLNIEDVKIFLDSIDTTEDHSNDLETPRMELRSDTRRKIALEESSFRTPTSTDNTKIKLSPEGKKVLDEHMKRGKTKKTAKDEIMKLVKKYPDDYGYLVKKGEGMKIKKIIVPPNKLSRLERVKVILGAIDADSTADYLDEYTVIVDSLLQDKMITNDQHKFLIKKYFDIINE